MLLVACATDSETSTLAAIKERGVLVVATSPDYAPFEFQTLVDGRNQVIGSDIALAQRIADRLGVELKVSSMSFDNVLVSLQSGKADMALAGLSYSEERARVFDFSESYYEQSDLLLVKTSEMSRYVQLGDLAGKKIAVQKGSTQELYAMKELTDATIISLSSMGEAINEVQSGQVDGVLLDAPVAIGYSVQNDDLSVSEMAFPVVPENAKVIAMPKGSGDLKAVVNDVVRELVASKDYERFIEDASKYTVLGE